MFSERRTNTSISFASTPGTLRWTCMKRVPRGRQGLDLGKVHGTQRRAHVRVVDQLARNLVADPGLGLGGGAADVRGEDDVGQAAQWREEGLGGIGGFSGEDVDSGTQEVTVAQR